MKKNNTAEKNLLEAQKLANALKEGTQKTLNQLLNEALDDFIEKDEETSEEEVEDPVETDGEDTTITDDSFDVEDVTTDVETDDETPEDGEESSEETEDDEWSKKLDDYKVGDNDYDLTNVDDDTAFEIFSKVGDSDLVHIKKQDDGTYEINDENSGAELVLDLDPDSEEDGEEDVDAEVTAYDVEDGDDEEFELELDDEDVETEDDEDDSEIEDDEDDSEIEIDLGDETEDDEEKEELDENLGYTDNYQNKDVITGLNVNEPADKSTTYSMDGGVPTDAKKPWAGTHTEPGYKKTGTDLAESIEDGELDENATTSKSQKRKVVKTMAPNSGEKDKPEVTKNTSVAGELVNEAKVQRIVELAKTILEENKKYKKSIEVIKNGLMEAYVTNVNYGRLVNILMNETTSKEEKRNIVERFKSVKTIKEGKTLTESIKRELNSQKNTRINLDEQISANSSKTINETVMFEQTSKNNPILNLMERMEKLPQLNGVKKNK